RAPRALAHQSESPLQRGPRAGADRAAYVDHLQLRRAVDQHGALYPDVHARVGTDRVRDELVAGLGDGVAGQHDRARADPLELPPGHQIWHPLPRLRARRIWHDRIEPPGVDARDRRVRLVL